MILYFTLLVVLSTISGTASLTCSTCSNATSLRECRLTEKCTNEQVCYKKREYTNQVQYSLGCIEKESCGRYAKIKKNSEISKMNLKQTSYCYECCSTDMCNNDLCDHPPNSKCKDSISVDCALLNSMFSICEVTKEAKKICPKFCDLCQLVDGNWSPWSSWSSCDVTCGKGSLRRHRECTDPSPKNGGLDCPGKGMEMKHCYLQLCPVHGGWSSWGNWEGCSTTCDDGLRKRTRSCTNPRPERFGDHCFGDSQEVESCNNGSCTRNVAFYVYITNSKGYYREGRVLIFPVVSFNDGNGYDPLTGKFTAPITGVYQFIAHICHQTNHHMIVAIIHGTKQIAITTGHDRIGATCNTVNAIARVEENEEVYVKARWSSSHLQADIWRWPSFSGFLLYR